jgi:hypothetical protein
MCTNGYHGIAPGALLMIHIVQIVRLETGEIGWKHRRALFVDLGQYPMQLVSRCPVLA